MPGAVEVARDEQPPAGVDRELRPERPLGADARHAASPEARVEPSRFVDSRDARVEGAAELGVADDEQRVTGRGDRLELVLAWLAPEHDPGAIAEPWVDRQRARAEHRARRRGCGDRDDLHRRSGSRPSGRRLDDLHR